MTLRSWASAASVKLFPLFLPGAMAFKFFTIPLRDVLSVASELNAFLGSHRVLGVDRQMVDRGANSFWTLCVEYLPGVVSAAAPSFDKKGRIDYREVLPPEDFLVFVKLRDLRKQLAQAEAAPVYTIFTNDQLAEMVRRRLTTLTDLQTIVGVGEARVAK
jgi:superfamily II DNA helicase RecQ